MHKPTAGWHADTIAIHGGDAPQDPHGALVAPLYQTSTFVFDSTHQGGQRFAGEEAGYIYSRLGNPTVNQLEQRIAELEGMQAGAAAATGMGAVAATMMAFLQQGDHVVASDAIYGCSFALFDHLFRRFGVDVSFVDMSDLEQTKAAFRDNTQLVFLETPANPHLKLVDIAAVSKLAHQHKARLVVDNTFMTPLLQRPGEFGADLVVHSATKYLNGHGDVVAGLVTGRSEDIELIKFTTLKDMGATMSPHDAWLILRGLKTLPVRMQRHCENALAVVAFLQEMQQAGMISRLYFPGVNQDEQSHESDLLQTQMKAAGAVIAFDMTGGFRAATRLLDQLSMIKLAVSLGDAESLIQHPASMTHSPLTPEARAAAGIGDGLVRLSVGLEHADDIITDLRQAFTSLKNSAENTAVNTD
ncbi:methionine gamma-lyase [Aliidiomarina sedimenti]|uniref:Methionine gamma-lyase n=1 Tax=Aliidiomarina sedimenti TaxID=1933879 RepID=A0ABY0C2W5_9GAMM|nr:aminotransferase class I/II-fold pyridoxal phosphate-dependent enzyme [Aliidiomarina sedimenti]RUO31937.1 methionine gamma-lyase [Aliidiomarina sedimenti]